MLSLTVSVGNLKKNVGLFKTIFNHTSFAFDDVLNSRSGLRGREEKNYEIRARGVILRAYNTSLSSAEYDSGAFFFIYFKNTIKIFYEKWF